MEEPFYPEKLSAHCRNLITSLLIKDPEKRLGMGGVEDVKCHPWFKVHSSPAPACVCVCVCVSVGSGLEQSAGQADTSTVQAIHLR